ncbi:MAG: hypothetical protein HN350_09100 [Phycisphaerales bacterium]|jgi:hypothetical protein|nr:hypothetical protein [Phycisphaerales bacterium]
MRNTILLVLLIGLTASVALAASGYYGDKKAAAKPAGFLSVLKPGQVVALAECGGSYELTISTSKMLSRYKVAEVGGNYVVLASQPKLSEIRIPLTSIRSIIHLKR